MISASKIGLLQHCQYWARADVEQDPRTESDASSRGTRVHAAIDEYIKNGNYSHGLTPPEQVMFEHAQKWIRSVGINELTAELPYVWDPTYDRAALIQREANGIQRAYSDPVVWDRILHNHVMSDAAIPMTIDLIHCVRYEEATIYDWCTGRTNKIDQLRMNALAFFRAHQSDGLERVHTVTLRLTEEGVTEERHETLDEFDIAMIAAEYAALIAQVSSSQPQVGMHCSSMYCPAKGSCPAIRSALDVVIPISAVVRYKFTSAIESQAHASYLLPQVKAAKAYIEQVEDNLKDYVAKRGPIPTSPGKAWGQGVRQDRRFNKEKALSLLGSMGATKEQIESTYTVTTVPVFAERNERDENQSPQLRPIRRKKVST